MENWPPKELGGMTFERTWEKDEAKACMKGWPFVSAPFFR